MAPPQRVPEGRSGNGPMSAQHAKGVWKRGNPHKCLRKASFRPEGKRASSNGSGGNGRRANTRSSATFSGRGARSGQYGTEHSAQRALRKGPAIGACELLSQTDPDDGGFGQGGAGTASTRPGSSRLGPVGGPQGGITNLQCGSYSRPTKTDIRTRPLPCNYRAERLGDNAPVRRAPRMIFGRI